MNVVGKVGSLISQGVYSVATPFHPFGGAVDIIAVQQQDGTFRSTPWYVRFGKFQGVLKGAEKIVRINVNGSEANFHMYLDNSGEAYFIREVVSGKGTETSEVIENSDSCKVANEDSGIDDDNINNIEKTTMTISRLEASVSDSGLIQLQDECASSGVDKLNRQKSEIEQRFYEFQEEQSSHEGSVELSEYGSSRFENLESVEHFVESKDSDSEVILVSVDGHVLTAPISLSEENTENVQLCTPQFHLGPGKEDLCEGNEDFSPGEDAWAANYLVDKSACNVAPENVCNNIGGSSDLAHQLEVCEDGEEHACQLQETKSTTKQERDAEEQVCQFQEPEDIADQERDFHMHSNSEDALEDASFSIKKEDIFKSCLELPELAMQSGQADFRDTVSPVEVPEETDNLWDKSPHSLQPDGITEVGIVKITNDSELSPSNFDSPGKKITQDLHIENEPTDKNVMSTEHMASNCMIVHSISDDPEQKDDMAQIVEGTISSPRRHAPADEWNENEIVEPKTAISGQGIQTDVHIRFEISLCGSKLHAGMGLRAAAESFDAHRVSEEEFKRSAASIIKNENLIIRYRDMYLPWDKAAQIVLGMAAFDIDLPIEPKDAIPVELDETPKSRDNVSEITTPSSGRRWRLWGIPFRRVKTLEHSNSNSSNEEVFVDSEPGSQNSQVEPIMASQRVNESPRKQLLKTHIPTTEQIASLNLREGQNMITFSFSTRVLGLQQVDAHIYLWRWNAKIVISDVDGTITKSDVLGQFMPLVGRDWTQSGVAQLFCAIKENGYHLLFLSARAIVQAYLTRSFLLNLKQDGKALPNGPVVISPDGLFPSLYREVIRRAPHEFKIACLEDIRALFPADYNPFYAGFGNRDTDELSYRKIGIPKGKIFIINPKGEVAINNRIDVKSYTSLHTLVNDMFPPTSLAEEEDFNSWNFWRMPLPEIDS
ncbi:phosphatidate phosphatase PAH1 isoform X2 [Malania oleifera]|uniref:phosphatidate phosphatase PAH1 isoform X2 n=1 Tax=Malania oleifera TaxID=397392 RepID=UPI0025AE080E|nr:phosphatidate phosphatase PAH1 isoform X2 [Malania oleifera]